MIRYIAIGMLALALASCESVNAIVDTYSGEGGLSLLKKASEVGGVVEDKTLGNAMKALPYYCQVPLASREVLRHRANARAEAGGAQIGVHCPSDPPLTLGEPAS